MMTKRVYVAHALALLAFGAAGSLGFAAANEFLFSVANFSLLLGAVVQLVALVGFASSNRVPRFTNKTTFAIWCALIFPAAIVRLPNWTPLFLIIAVPVGFLMAYLLISILRFLWSVVWRSTAAR